MLEITNEIKILSEFYNEILVFGTLILLFMLTELLKSGVHGGRKTVGICPNLTKIKGDGGIHLFSTVFPTTVSSKIDKTCVY